MESKCVVLFAVLVVLFRRTESCGPTSNFETVTVKETDPPGHVVLNITAEAGVVWLVKLRGSEDLSAESPVFKWLEPVLIINHTKGADHHYVELTKQLDLEFVYHQWKQKLSIVKYQLICQQSGSADTTFELFVNVQAVNEFSPKFIGAPFNITVPENALVERLVIRLRDNATDRDVVNSGDTDVHEFNMVALPLPWNDDIGNPFHMTDKQNGEVRVIESLDFEAFPSPHRAYMAYEVMVFDRDLKKKSTQLTIRIQDVDDQPPYFFHPGCTPVPCEVFYICEVSYDFTGVITDMTPAPIKARDGDTLGYRIKYRIRTGPQKPRFNRFLAINSATGVITVLEPLGAYSKPEIVLLIQATEVSIRKLHKDTTLIIKIKFPHDYVFPNTTTQSTFTQAPNPTDSSKTVVVAVVTLSTFVLIAFIVLSGLIVHLKNKAENPVYPAGEIEEELGEEEEDEEGKLQRGGSNTDSGQWSMNGVPAAASYRASQRGQAGPSGVKTGPRASRVASGRSMRRTASAMSSGEVSIASVGDIHPQEDPMLQEHMQMAAVHGGPQHNGSMALVHAQMHGNEVLAEEDETDFINGGETSGGQPRQPRPRPPKSAPSGATRTAKTPKRPQSSRNPRKEQSKSAKGHREVTFDATMTYDMATDPSLFMAGHDQRAALSALNTENMMMDPTFLMSATNEHAET